ncbi:MAG: ATP-binding protein [Roseivirga sp.]
MNSSIDYLDVDHLIVYAFLATILFAGLYVGRDIKDMDDYALTGKSYNLLTLVFTFLATALGSSLTTRMSASIFTDGIIMVVASLGNILSSLFVAFYIIPRAVTPKGSMSIAEMMGHFYGSKVRTITGVIGTVYCVGIMAAQMLVLGFIAELVMHVDKTWSIVISGAIMITHTVLGGIRSIVTTSIIKLSAIIAFIPLMCSMATNKAGGVIEILNAVPPDRLVIWGHKRFNDYFILFFLGMIPTLIFSPPQIQKILMADSRYKIQTMLLSEVSVGLPLRFIVLLVSFSALILFPSIDPNVVLPYVIYKTTPIALKGICIAGVLAITMSAANSCLHTGSILLVHDILKPISDKKNIPLDELQWVRYATLLLGLVAIFMAIKGADMSIVFLGSASLFSVLIIIPFVAGWIGMKVSAKAFYIALFSTITWWVGKSYAGNGIDRLTLLLTFIINGITFFIIHVSENKGFAFVEKEEAGKEEEQAKHPARALKRWSWVSIKTWLAQYAPTPKNIIAYSTNRVSKYGANHIVFATFICLHYVFPHFMWAGGKVHHFDLLTVVRFLGAVMCVPLLLKRYWPTSVLPYFPVYWHTTVMYVLPFTNAFAFLITGGTKEWLINIALAIMMLIAVVDWLSSIILIVLGTGLGILCYYLLFFCLDDVTLFCPDWVTVYQTIYTCIFSAAIGFLFLRKREKEADKRLEALELFAKAVAHEVKNVVGISKSYASSIRFFSQQMRIDKVLPTEDHQEVLLIKVDKRAYTLLNEIIEGLTHDSDRGMETINRMLATMRNNVSEHDFAILSMQTCVGNALEAYGLTKYQQDRILVDLEEDFMFYGSEYYIQHIIFNLLKNAYKYSRKDCTIEIWLKNNELHFKDDGPGIAEEDLPYIFDHFFTTDTVGTGIGLAFCRLVMEEFGGTITCRSKQGNESFTELILSFPEAETQNEKRVRERLQKPR